MGGTEAEVEGDVSPLVPLAGELGLEAGDAGVVGGLTDPLGRGGDDAPAGGRREEHFPPRGEPSDVIGASRDVTSISSSGGGPAGARPPLLGPPAPGGPSGEARDEAKSSSSESSSESSRGGGDPGWRDSSSSSRDSEVRDPPLAKLPCSNLRGKDSVRGVDGALAVGRRVDATRGGYEKMKGPQ